MPDNAIEDYLFVHPDFFFDIKKVPAGAITIYAVRGNDPLRVMVIGYLSIHSEESSSNVVVGGDTCLACSLALCRRADAKYLVC